MRHVEIEALLRWAYRDELPKAQERGGEDFLGGSGYAVSAQGSGWDAISAFGALMTVVDVQNLWGVIPDRYASDDPHPDAIAVGLAVERLDRLELDFPDDWAPLDDLGGLAALGDFGLKAMADARDRLSIVGSDGVRRLRTSPRLLVFRHAILGGAPEWECEPPQVRYVCGDRGWPKWFVKREMWTEDLNGNPIREVVETDGYNATRQRPYPDAYRKTYLDPDPTQAIVARGEYQVWHAALALLVEDLAGVLTSRVALPSPRAATPWEDAATASGRVLPDMTRRMAPPPVPTKPRRRKVAA